MPESIAVPQSEAQDLLHKRMQERGDLPIIRRNGAKILTASENSESGASDVARIILHDPGFAAKVLKVANAAYFNRGQESIGTISKAVVLLGLDMIRQISLGLGFVEMFEKHHPKIDMKRLVADAFASAVLGQELAESLGHPCPEEAFVASLLHNLGRISVAYYLPEAYLEIQKQVAEEGRDAEETERELLGGSCSEIGVSLAHHWKLPQTVTESMELDQEAVSKPAVSQREKMLWAAYLSNRITENLFSQQASPKDFDYWVTRLEVGMNIKQTAGLKVIENAYKKVCQMAESFEMPPTLFSPQEAAEDSKDSKSARHRLVGRMERNLNQFLAESKKEDKQEEAPSQPAEESLQEMDPSKRDSLQLEYLRKITSHMMNNSDLNGLFTIVLEGVQKGIGFERVLLVLCNPERTRFQGRYGVGPGTRDFAARLDLPNQPKDNIFAKVYADRKPCFVESVDRLGFRRLIPEVLKESGKVHSFAISPIHAANNVIGFFYADNAVSGKPVQPSSYDAFLHFVFQANLGLERLSRSSEEG